MGPSSAATWLEAFFHSLGTYMGPGAMAGAIAIIYKGYRSRSGLTQGDVAQDAATIERVQPEPLQAVGPSDFETMLEFFRREIAELRQTQELEREQHERDKQEQDAKLADLQRQISTVRRDAVALARAVRNLLTDWATVRLSETPPIIPELDTLEG